MMNDTTESTHDLVLLEQIEHDPDITQASMATRLGVAVGTVNWHIKRLIAKGYVKVKRAERRKLRYIITPEGIAFRARLTVDYIEQSMLLYRNTRRRVSDLLGEVKRAGYDNVVLEGDGDIADVCRLTCMEHGIKVSASQPSSRTLPGLVVQGVEVGLRPAGKSLLQESTQP
jgi:DNA-binding MarR family transcriptional regulator